MSTIGLTITEAIRARLREEAGRDRDLGARFEHLCTLLENYQDVLDGIQDPGNVGTVVRAGAAATEGAASVRRPRRIRLVKAMAALGKAMETPPAAKAAPLTHSRSCKLSQLDELRLDMLKRRLAGQGVRVKKRDLLRAALSVLAELDDARLRDAIAALDEPTPGNPGLPS